MTGKVSNTCMAGNENDYKGVVCFFFFVFFKQKTAYEMRTSGVQTCALPISHGLPDRLGVDLRPRRCHLRFKPEVCVRQIGRASCRERA